MCPGCSPAQGPHLIVWLVVLGYGGPPVPCRVQVVAFWPWWAGSGVDTPHGASLQALQVGCTLLTILRVDQSLPAG